jgi:hypothetical protein
VHLCAAKMKVTIVPGVCERDSICDSGELVPEVT